MNGSRQTLVHHLPNVISSIRIGAAVLVWLGIPAMFEPEISRWFFRILFAFAAVSDGVDGLLAKPITVKELLAAVAQVMSSCRPDTSEDSG